MFIEFDFKAEYLGSGRNTCILMKLVKEGTQENLLLEPLVLQRQFLTHLSDHIALLRVHRKGQFEALSKAVTTQTILA